MTQEVRMARGATLATALATPVVLAVAFLAAGGKGVLGAVFGLALAVAFFSATLLAVGGAGRVSTDLMVPAALLTFIVKMAAIGMLLFLLRDTTAFDRAAFALSLVAGTCVYLAAEIRFAMRARIPYVEGSGEPQGGAPVGRVADEKKASPR
jgi:ATP synthase protein I